jgi:hydroxymethylbilane synthase
MARLVFGSRESELAVAQSQLVMTTVQKQFPDLELELKTFKTTGDRLLDSPLSQIGGKGLFVKELEVALLEGEIDCAVHSMKDMPGEQPNGLIIYPFGQREIPFDAFISRDGHDFMGLPPDSVVGTASLRRQVIMRHRRPDLRYEIIRGNVQTRLQKLDDGEYDALVLASAGLYRLGLQQRITHSFTLEEMIPACCQGTLGIELANAKLLQWFIPFIDPQVEAITQAERGFLFALQGSCQVPLAGYAEAIDTDIYVFRGMLSDLQGKKILHSQCRFMAENAREAGEHAAQMIRDQGGGKIIQQILKASQ